MRLHESAQPSPGRVHAVETVGANSASTTRGLRVTPEAAAAEAGVAVEADHDDIAWLNVSEQTGEAIVEGVVLSSDVTRGGGVRCDEKDTHLATVLMTTPATADDETHAEEAIALCVLLASSAVPCRVSSAREQDAHALGATAAQLLRWCRANKGEARLLPSLIPSSPRLLAAYRKRVASLGVGDQLTDRSIRLGAVEVLLIDGVTVEAIAATAVGLAAHWKMRRRHSSSGGWCRAASSPLGPSAWLPIAFASSQRRPRSAAQSTSAAIPGGLCTLGDAYWMMRGC